MTPDERDTLLHPLLDRIPKGEGWFPEIYVDDGWVPLVVKLDQNLAKILPDYQIFQVKSKLGGLRYYTDISHTHPAHALIDSAEDKSQTICEFCGEPGELVVIHGWYATLCPTHKEEYMDG